jgi:signal transduction histidine kinase
MRIHPFRSSSTKLAMFFSTLLGVALLLLCAEIYALTRGAEMEPVLSKIILALVVFICGGLFIVSFYVTKRINTIAATADHIIATRDLSKRIPIDNRWDDLSKLSTVLNAMLEEIEQLVAGVRQVSDNISHDLRTPLTRLRNHLETMRGETLTAPATPEEQYECLGELVSECDGLLATFNALLRIANIESGRRLAAFHTVNLANVLQDVVELYEPVAADKNLKFGYRMEPTLVEGDKDLLFQAIANLLDNAIKYTPDGGTVVITVAPHADGAQIILRDSGHGIADEFKPHVFRRFYRITKCRSLPGSGLGLSLVAAIVKLHQGTITLTDNTPTGLVVTVTI